MPIRTNTFTTNTLYDITNSGQNAYIGSNILFSWGYNNSGVLGQNNRTYYSSPVQIPGTTWNNISAAARYSYATQLQ